MTKIRGRAKRIRRLRDSGLFEEYPFLEESLVLDVNDGKYILYERISFIYWIFQVDSGYRLLQSINKGKVLDLEELECNIWD